jgi:putative transposase
VAPIRSGAAGAYSLKYHLVWCPKYRRPVLVDAVAERLTELLYGKAVELGV